MMHAQIAHLKTAHHTPAHKAEKPLALSHEKNTGTGIQLAMDAGDDSKFERY
ncbi:hypothetical protein WDW89_17155 [Deltaproteobacteria bacterium TL4]